MDSELDREKNVTLFFSTHFLVLISDGIFCRIKNKISNFLKFFQQTGTKIEDYLALVVREQQSRPISKQQIHRVR